MHSANDECMDDADTNRKNPSSPMLLKTSVDKRTCSPNTPHIYQGPVSPLHNPRHQSPKTVSPSNGSPTNIQRKGSFRRRNKSVGAAAKSSYEQYEEKPLPTLRQ